MLQPSNHEPEAFDGADSATVFDRDVVDFQAMVARLAARNPGVSVSRISTLVLQENEAMTGGVPVAVPALVFEGVQELLERGLGSAVL